MKRTIIFLSILLLVTCVIYTFMGSTKAGVGTYQDLPDAVCVYLNGEPVVGAYVKICDPVQPFTGTTGGSGCAPFNVQSGTRCVEAVYGGYANATKHTFVSGVDIVEIHLVYQGPRCACDIE